MVSAPAMAHSVCVTDHEPLQATALAALEQRIGELADPAELLALATAIDQLGMQLAYEIRRYGAGSELAAPLKPVLLRVPVVHARALLRTAERYDDVGSPRRAAFVLIEALRKSFSADTLATAAHALAFLLDAHGQPAAATRVRALMAEVGDGDRRAIRARFEAGLDELRDRDIAWAALDDEPQSD